MLTALVLFGAALGCGSETPIEPRALHAHYPSACAPDDDSSGSRAIEVRALGDFDPGNTTVAFVADNDRDRVLGIPDRTRAVELRTIGPEPHWGMSLVAEGAETDIALWPILQSCQVFSEDTASNSPVEGAALAVNDSWLLAIGTDDSEGSARGTRLVNLGTGNEPDSSGAPMTRSRSFASLTAVEGGLLAAGGEDLEQGAVHDDAELFDLAAQRFQGNASVIALRHARTRHAALALDASSVVLIGGADGNGQPVRDLERVSLIEGESTNLAQLGAGRIAPTAVRLSDGRIVVAGGYAVGTGSQPVPIGIVEWFNANATRQIGTLNLEDAALGRAFLSTATGGLLAVGGCDADDQPSPAVWWIDAEQQATRLPDLPQGARSCRPELAAATLGAPFLFSNGALWRFNPWTAQFSASEIALPSTTSPTHVLSVDSGLMVWLDGDSDETSLIALRHDTRNTYSADVTPFLLADDTRLAPARPGALASPSTGDSSLQLEADVAVWITDTEYLDFDLEVATADDDSPPPKVLIGSSEVGGSSCRWPAPTQQGVFRARRRGAQVTLLGSHERSCSLNDAARASVGFQAEAVPVRLGRISISRGAP